MRNLVRKCRGIGGVSVAKVSGTTSAISTSSTSNDTDHDRVHVVGVMTRARRALAMAPTPARSGEVEKRRKLDQCKSTNSSELQFAPSYVQIRTRPRQLIAAATENSSSCSGSGGDRVVSMSRCSSNGSSKELAHEKSEKSLRSGYSDLESEGFEFDNNSSAARALGCTTESTTTRENSNKSARTPKLGDLEAESDDLDQARRPSAASSRRGSADRTAPSEAELDEFFTAAESAEKKRFTEKYNFDVAKDVPLKGRYEWVRLKP
ncbi:hypothetical protein Scep_020327 [Stephania cephalantha]|uniref:Cyclin-dependent kinase inhibitor domain-containing protein n=1 Tax=Stephania cephalantha TaxID=152367 RepID=A0AAP0NN30_9MAGN